MVIMHRIPKSTDIAVNQAIQSGLKVELYKIAKRLPTVHSTGHSQNLVADIKTFDCLMIITDSFNFIAK
jgi:hypothetical protein